jgi:hypothetical protein
MTQNGRATPFVEKGAMGRHSEMCRTYMPLTSAVIPAKGAQRPLSREPVSNRDEAHETHFVPFGTFLLDPGSAIGFSDSLVREDKKKMVPAKRLRTMRASQQPQLQRPAPCRTPS